MKKTPTVQYLGNGVATDFAYLRANWDEDDIYVYLGDELQTEGYTIIAEDLSEGAVIRFDVAPADGVLITITRILVLERTTHFEESGVFKAEVINDELDRLVAMIQQINETANRGMLLPITVSGANTQLPSPNPGKAIIWNPEGSGFQNSKDNFDDIIANNTLLANSVASNAAKALNSERAAAQSAIAAENSKNEAAQIAIAAEDSARAAEESANEASKYATKAAFGNIGDIKHTTRTDVPNGGAWCDGAEYTKEAFPDVYQMLVDGKISSTDYTTFDDSVSTNGSCGLFALDTATTSFKVPLLKDVYIKAGDTPLIFGAESLPNIKGNTGYNWGGTWEPSGVFASASGSDGVYGGTSGATSRVDFDASRVSSTYQDGAKVNPDHVVYRAYVVLYASAAGASEAQAAEFMTALGGKANVGLDNITAEAKDLIAGLGMPSTQYIELDNITNGAKHTSPANGFFALSAQASQTNADGTIALLNTTKNIISKIMGLVSGNSNGVFVPAGKNDVVQVGIGGSFNTKVLRFIYAEGSKE